MRHKKLKRKKDGNTKRVLRASRHVSTIRYRRRLIKDPTEIIVDRGEAIQSTSGHGDETERETRNKKQNHYLPNEIGDSLTYDFWARGNTVSGEQRMWYSVLALTLRDYKRGSDDAWGWVWDNGYDVGSYMWICEKLEMCPFRIRSLIMAGRMIEPASSCTITWTLRANSLPKSVDIERRKRLKEKN